MSAILAGFSINTSGSPRRLAQRDTESYWRTLLAAGGTDINANDQVAGIQAFLEHVYSGYGRAALAGVIFLRSTQNAGTGTRAFAISSAGVLPATLINGASWAANGVGLVATSTQRIDLLNITGTGPDLALWIVCSGAASQEAFAIATMWQGPTFSTAHMVVGRGGTTTSRSNSHLAVSSGGANFADLNLDTRSVDFRSLITRINASNILQFRQHAGLSATSSALAVSAFSLDRLYVGTRAATAQQNISWTGTVAMVAAFRNRAVYDDTALYTLYKSALGSALSLP